MGYTSGPTQATGSDLPELLAGSEALVADIFAFTFPETYKTGSLYGGIDIAK